VGSDVPDLTTPNWQYYQQVNHGCQWNSLACSPTASATAIAGATTAFTYEIKHTLPSSSPQYPYFDVDVFTTDSAVHNCGALSYSATSSPAGISSTVALVGGKLRITTLASHAQAVHDYVVSLTASLSNGESVT